jgi:hypothetical protein
MGRSRPLMLPAEIYNPVVALSERQRQDRAKVNEAVERYREARAWSNKG